MLIRMTVKQGHINGLERVVQWLQEISPDSGRHLLAAPPHLRRQPSGKQLSPLHHSRGPLRLVGPCKARHTGLAQDELSGMGGGK